MSGWIKTHRSLVKWEWYTAPNMVHFFIHLIINANHKDSRWRGIPVKRGQLIVGRKKLSQQTGISEQSVRTCLKNLQISEEITIKPTKLYSLITICNYDKYQDFENDANHQSNQQNDQPANPQSNQRPTNVQPTANQRPTTNKKEKNIKNEKKGKKKEEPQGPLSGSSPILTIFQKEMFAKIWSHYPKQIGEVDAQWAFVKLDPNPDIMARIISGIQLFRDHAWDDIKFIPGLAKFISSGQYEEDPRLNGPPLKIVKPVATTVRQAQTLENDEAARILIRMREEDANEQAEQNYIETGDGDAHCLAG